MKRWTVMLLPESHQGACRRLDLSAAHLWSATGLFVMLAVFAVTLTFALSYSYSKNQVSRVQLKELQRENRRLSLRTDEPVALTASTALSGANSRDDIEREVREQYEASKNAITSELARLLEYETQLRQIYGLGPRVNSAANYISSSTDEGGQGGPPGRLANTRDLAKALNYRPRDLIYGLANPSADLILQEIELRTSSLRELLTDIKAAQEQLQRTPSGWPIKSRKRRLSSHFGYRKDPFTRAVRHHDGTDIAAAYGSPVSSTGRGVVIYSGFQSDYGNVVQVDHGGGYVTLYAHMSKCLVKVGDKVRRGDAVGNLGSTGRSTGPHLHYEIRKNKQAIDAEPYLF